MSKQLDKKALKRSFFASASKLIGVALGASAGTMIQKMVGVNVNGWGLAASFAITSFILIWIAEYGREVD